MTSSNSPSFVPIRTIAGAAGFAGAPSRPPPSVRGSMRARPRPSVPAQSQPSASVYSDRTRSLGSPSARVTLVNVPSRYRVRPPPLVPIQSAPSRVAANARTVASGAPADGGKLIQLRPSYRYSHPVAPAQTPPSASPWSANTARSRISRGPSARHDMAGGEQTYSPPPAPTASPIHSLPVSSS